jgi:hypothetical protein
MILAKPLPFFVRLLCVNYRQNGFVGCGFLRWVGLKKVFDFHSLARCVDLLLTLGTE